MTDRTTYRWFTYDVVGSILFGEPIGFLEKRKDIHGLVAATSQAFDTIDYLARVPKLSWFYRETYLGRKLFQQQSEYQNGIRILLNVMMRGLIKSSNIKDSLLIDFQDT